LVAVVGRTARQNRPALVDFLPMNSIIFTHRKAMSWSGNHFESMACGGGIYLARINDAHCYRVDNIEKAAAEIPHDEFLFQSLVPAPPHMISGVIACATRLPGTCHRRKNNMASGRN
jgi:hypothetical protein